MPTGLFGLKFKLPLLLLLIFAHAPLFGAVSSTITYQGSLKQNGALVNGNVNMEFVIQDENGTPLWSTVKTINVKEGLYRAELVPENVDWANIEAFLQIKINGGAVGSPERLTSTPYALTAHNLAGDSTAAGDLNVTGTLGVNADNISIAKLNVRSDTNDSVNTLVHAGANSNGENNLMLQQYITNDWKYTNFLTGNGRVISAPGWPYPKAQNDGNGHKFQSVMFHKDYFGFAYKDPNSENILPAATVDPDDGNVGIGITDPADKLTVNGDIRVSGALVDESGLPAVFVAVISDACPVPEGHPYVGCPAGYSLQGYWDVPGNCNIPYAFGYSPQNGSIRSGVMGICAAD